MDLNFECWGINKVSEHHWERISSASDSVINWNAGDLVSWNLNIVKTFFSAVE